MTATRSLNKDSRWQGLCTRILKELTRYLQKDACRDLCARMQGSFKMKQTHTSLLRRKPQQISEPIKLGLYNTYRTGSVGTLFGEDIAKKHVVWTDTLIYICIYIYIYMIYIYIYNIYIYNITNVSKRDVPKMSATFLRCFWGGAWKCKLTFWRNFEDLPHKKRHLGDVQRTILTFKDSPKNLSFWYGPPWKVAT